MMNQVSIPEETPSMVHLEHSLHNNTVPKPTEEVRRILPEVPKLLPPPPPTTTLTQPEPDIVPKPKISPKPTTVVNQVKSTQGS